MAQMVIAFYKKKFSHAKHYLSAPGSGPGAWGAAIETK